MNCPYELPVGVSPYAPTVGIDPHRLLNLEYMF
jgi:hypothetical protein